jgi:hypothetical protein
LIYLRKIGFRIADREALWKSVIMKYGNLSTELAPLVPPSCSTCGEATRLVGLEAAADGDEYADLCTYECPSCGQVQTRIFVQTGGVKLIDVLEQADAANGANGANGSGAADDTAPAAPAADKPVV